MNINKFNPNAKTTLEDILKTRIGQIYTKLNDGIEISQDEKDIILRESAHCGFKGSRVRLLGFDFDFTRFLNRYWVKIKGYGIEEWYAMNKMAIRNYQPMKNDILEIAEVPNDRKVFISPKKDKPAPKKQLKSSYPLIWAWGRLMGSYGEYIERQVEKAKKDNAPFDALSKNDDGSWSTLESFKGESWIKSGFQKIWDECE